MRYRKVLLATFVLAAVCTAASFYMQYGMGMDPCVLCIEQRLALIATGLIALLCLLLPDRTLFMRTLTALLTSVAAVAGLGVALYQIRLQHMPMMEQPSCGAPLTFRWSDAPLFDWYEPIIRGTGNCGVVDRFMGVSLPVWSALLFGAVLLWLWVNWWRNRRQTT